MRRALNLSPQHTVQASWMSRNCSGSEFLYAGDGFTLTAFNTHPHLNDVAMLIYHQGIHRWPTFWTNRQQFDQEKSLT
jgi:hypothetical protein